ncbi:MAG: GNAT family N-acetyltransferase [archaeon]|jgi:ribosomal protein S18 acetylase RimI-like enzyme
MSHYRTTIKGKVSSVSMSTNGRAIKGKKLIRQFWTRELGHTTRKGLKQVVAFSQDSFGKIKGKIGVWDKDRKVARVEFFQRGNTKKTYIVVEGLQTRTFYQKEGIASQVLSEIISIAKKRPTVTSVVLAVRADNPSAISIYKKIGFEETSKYSEVQHGEKVDCMAMRLELSK